jgi:hypothetical protein
MSTMTFRNSKIIYYGPHPCDNCGVLVAKMGHDFGGTAFTYPEGPIYPNTEWHPHVCDPRVVFAKMAQDAKSAVLRLTGYAVALKEDSRWVIVANDEPLCPPQLRCMTEADAWIRAKAFVEDKFRAA